MILHLLFNDLYLLALEPNKFLQRSLLSATSNNREVYGKDETRGLVLHSLCNVNIRPTVHYNSQQYTWIKIVRIVASDSLTCSCSRWNGF